MNALTAEQRSCAAVSTASFATSGHSLVLVFTTSLQTVAALGVSYKVLSYEVRCQAPGSVTLLQGHVCLTSDSQGMAVGKKAARNLSCMSVPQISTKNRATGQASLHRGDCGQMMLAPTVSLLPRVVIQKATQ